MLEYSFPINLLQLGSVVNIKPLLPLFELNKLVWLMMRKCKEKVREQGNNNR